MAFDFSDFELQCELIFEQFSQELARLRTGKATAQLLDSVRVEAYGSRLTLQEIASITVVDPTLLIVKPYDASQLEAIEKGIRIAELNLNPIVGQDDVKVPVPPLTEERRKEMIKVLQQKQEATKVMLRGARSEAKQAIDAQAGTAGVSEDDIHLDLQELDERFQAQVAQLEELVDEKEADLLEI